MHEACGGGFGILNILNTANIQETIIMEITGSPGEVRASFRVMPAVDQLRSVFGVARNVGSGKQYVANAINPSSSFPYARVIVARLEPGNNVDLSFGENGLAEIRFEGTELSRGLIGLSMAVHTDGGVVIIARAMRPIGSGTSSVVALVRLTNDGLLDENFGNAGMRIHHIAGLASYAQPLAAVQPGASDAVNEIPAQVATAITLASGKLFFVSQISAEPGPGLLVRFLPTGDLDTTFGEGGVVQVVVPGYEGHFVFLQAVTELSNGKIAVCGGVRMYAGPAFMRDPKCLVLRLNEDGSRDSSFGNAGLSIIDVPEVLSGKDYSDYYYLQSVAEGADDTLVCAGDMSIFTEGRYSSKGVLLRLDAAGLLDPSFNDGKIVVSGARGDFHSLGVVGVQADGKVVAAGSVQDSRIDPASSEFFVARFNADGAPDVSFARRGWTTATFGIGVNLANSMWLEADEIILAGMYGQRGAVNGSVVINFFT